MAESAEQDIRAALAEAVAESDFPTDEKLAEEDDWDFSTESVPAADDGSIPGKVDDETDEESPETDAAQGDIPDTYFGVDLTGIPAEQARSIYESLQQQDTYIQKLQARLAQEPEAPATPAPAETVEEVTDEALLQALGFDPDDWETQQLAPKILPLARTVIDLEEKVDSIVAAETTRTVANQWNTQLDELESTYGSLPFDRVQVLKYAIDEGLTSPFETYFRIAAPARKEVETAVSTARRTAAKQAVQGGVKPRTSASTTTAIDPKMSLRDAVKVAMAETEKETGLKFKNIFKGKTRMD